MTWVSVSSTKRIANLYLPTKYDQINMRNENDDLGGVERAEGGDQRKTLRQTVSLSQLRYPNEAMHPQYARHMHVISACCPS